MRYLKLRRGLVVLLRLWVHLQIVRRQRMVGSSKVQHLDEDVPEEA